MKVAPYADDGNVSAYKIFRKNSKLSDHVQSSIEDSVESLVSMSKKLMNKSLKQDQTVTKSVLATSNYLLRNFDDLQLKDFDNSKNKNDAPYNKLMSSNIRYLKNNSIKEKFHTTIITQSDANIEEKNYTVIKELNEGKYFGEIS